MDGFTTALATIERPGQGDQFVAEVLADNPRRRITRKCPSDLPLRCVSSGYLSDGCSCPSTIPTSVVRAAWAREQQVGLRRDRLFHFAWRGEVWLAYGLHNGRVRGVYCPVHAAERDQRSFLDGPRESAPAPVFALTA